MPKQLHHALTAARVRTLTTPGTYGDGDGLTLRVGKGGKQKSWVLRARIDGKAANIGLGGYPAVGLREARDNAAAMMRDIRARVDPVAERRQARAGKQAESARLPVPTFRGIAAQVIEFRRPTWSNAKYATQWADSFANYAYPTIGDMAIDAVTPADVLAVLTPVWHTKAETATRVKQRMETVFDFAIAQGLRIDNPAAAVTRALPRRPRLKAHHPALPYAEVPAAIAAIRESTAYTSTRLALEFVILAAARTGEVLGATWGEIDVSAATWTVPAARMKMRREHRVPLSDRAMAILAEARELGKGDADDDGLIFPRSKGGQLSNMAFVMLLRRLGIACVTHGFRSSFKDWSIESGFDWAISETALAHRLGNSLESAYARTDLFDRRRELMQVWADYLNPA